MTRPALLLAILLGAVALLSTLAGPASAQHVINNPGWCAQFYPNANCQNYGPGNPYTSYGWRRAYNSYGYRGHHRRYGSHRHYREPVGRANLSSSHW
jgi:hypothetical protein